MQPVKLSVIIIGRNEAQFIGRSITSALAVQDRVPGLEVIFVDSASTDDSVAIASNFPIRIYQLRPEWPRCVAAGRYTGWLHATGQYILFLDGDAEIDDEWLVRAIDFMDAHDEYGGIAGVLDEEYITPEGTRVGGVQNVFMQDTTRAQVDCSALGGIAMFRQSAIRQAGPVNPHLPTGEDDELCMRLRICGFKLARISGRMAIKYTEKRETLREVLRRSRTKMYDYGAVVKHAAQYGRGCQYCREAIPYVVSFVATVCLFLIGLPLAVYWQMVWLPAGIAGLLFLVLLIKKGSLHLALLSIAVRAVSAYRTVLSYWRTKPLPIEAYPTDVIQIR